MVSIDIVLLFHPTTPGVAMLGDLNLQGPLANATYAGGYPLK